MAEMTWNEAIEEVVRLTAKIFEDQLTLLQRLEAEIEELRERLDRLENDGEYL